MRIYSIYHWKKNVPQGSRSISIKGCKSKTKLQCLSLQSTITLFNIAWVVLRFVVLS